MKLLMTTDTVGGVWTYALELAAALAPHDVEIALATMGAPLTDDQRSEVERLANVVVYESDYRLEWMLNPWSDVARAGVWLKNLAARLQPDLVHLNNFVHGALPWKVPVLMVGHSCVCSWFRAVRQTEAGSEWDRYRAEVRAGLQAAQMVVAPTAAMLRCLHEHYGPLSPVRVVANARNPRRYCPGLKLPFVLAAGRLWDEAKNFGTLAQAAPEIDWPVRIAGEDRHPDGGRAEWEAVERLGRLSSERLGEQLAQASIYALPVRYEPFGLSALEAALSGCALVLGDIPSLREVWGDAACFVPPDDAPLLAEEINRLIDDPDLRRQQAMQAQRRALQYTPERLARDYMAAYGDLLQSIPARRVFSTSEFHPCTS